jgi:hypothetical protein
MGILRSTCWRARLRGSKEESMRHVASDASPWIFWQYVHLEPRIHLLAQAATGKQRREHETRSLGRQSVDLLAIRTLGTENPPAGAGGYGKNGYRASHSKPSNLQMQGSAKAPYKEKGPATKCCRPFFAFGSALNSGAERALDKDHDKQGHGFDNTDCDQVVTKALTRFGECVASARASFSLHPCRHTHG